MTPFEKVLELYRNDPLPDDLPFERYLEQHFVHGFVFSTPEFFVMGRPVVRSAGALVSDPFVLFPRAECDTWHVFAMAGDIAKAWKILPWPLPWLAFERRLGGELELRFYSLDVMKRLSLPPPCAKNPPSPAS